MSKRPVAENHRGRVQRCSRTYCAPAVSHAETLRLQLRLTRG